MLAKGRLLGIQFEALLEPDEDGSCLYFELAKRADMLALRIKDRLCELGFQPCGDSPTQPAVLHPAQQAHKEAVQKYSFSINAPVDKDRTSVRICTSWATTDEAVDTLLKDMEKAAKKLFQR